MFDPESFLSSALDDPESDYVYMMREGEGIFDNYEQSDD